MTMHLESTILVSRMYLQAIALNAANARIKSLLEAVTFLTRLFIDMNKSI
jgi:hypothetical protein